MRGRNNNNNNNNGGNRRGPNPLTRSYESNGPDVKIRGTAQHIGEKYLQLARDAQTSGDPVAAENYLQHAEHYFRIIATAQQAQQQAQTGYQRQPGELEAEDDGDDDLMMPDRFSLPSERFAAQQQAAGTTTNANAPASGTGTGPQPYPDRGGFNGERQNNGQDRYERPQGGGDTGYRAERQDQDQRQGRDQRQDRGEPRQDYRQDRGDQRQDRGDQRQDRGEQRQDRGDQRQDREQRPYADRNGYDRNAGERQQSERQSGERNFRNDRGSRNPRYARDGQDNRGDRDNRYSQGGDQPQQPAAEDQAVAPAAELPAFITAPVRPVSTSTPDPIETSVNVSQPEVQASAPTPVTAQVSTAPHVEAPSSENGAGDQTPVVGGDGEAFAVRPRRRRRTRAMIEADAAAAAVAAGEPPASE